MSASIDAKKFLALVEAHRVISQVRNGNSRIFSDQIKEGLKDAYRANKLFQLTQLSALLALQENLRAGHIEMILLKGAALSQLLYNDPGERASRDIDLLIHKKDIDAALSVMEELGYVCLTRYTSPKQKEAIVRYTHHFEFQHPDSGILVEVHWKLSSTKGSEFEEKSIWENAVKLSISGHDFKVLSGETLVAYLCIHGTLHYFFRLQWIVDLYALYQNFSEAELEALHHRLKQSNMQRPFHASLLLLQALFDFRIPESIATAVDRKARKIAHLCHAQIVENTSIVRKDSGGKETFRYHRIQYLTSGWSALLRSLFARNVRPKNWEFFAFPDSVFFLNHLFSRPIWLLRKLFSRET